MLDCSKIVYQVMGEIDLTPYVRNLTFGERPQELAMYCEMDIQVPLLGEQFPASRWLGQMVALNTPITIFAGVTTPDRPVFQGRVYRWRAMDGPLPHIQVTLYDPLFSLMKSRDDYKSVPQPAENVLADLFAKIGANYHIKTQGRSMGTLATQLFRRRTYAEMIASILYEVETKTGFGWHVRWDPELQIIQVVFPGMASTEEIYWFRADESVETVSDELDITNFVSEVVISAALSTENEVDPNPTVISGDSQYGLFREIIHQDEYPTPEEVTAAAQNLLDMRGLPTRRSQVTVPDIPWLRRGDLVKITAGTLNGHYVVNAVEHDPMQRKMQLEVGILFEMGIDSSLNASEVGIPAITKTIHEVGVPAPHPRVPTPTIPEWEEQPQPWVPIAERGRTYTPDRPPSPPPPEAPPPFTPAPDPGNPGGGSTP